MTVPWWRNGAVKGSAIRVEANASGRVVGDQSFVPETFFAFGYLVLRIVGIAAEVLVLLVGQLVCAPKCDAA